MTALLMIMVHFAVLLSLLPFSVVAVGTSHTDTLTSSRNAAITVTSTWQSTSTETLSNEVTVTETGHSASNEATQSASLPSLSASLSLPSKTKFQTATMTWEASETNTPSQTPNPTKTMTELPTVSATYTQSTSVVETPSLSPCSPDKLPVPFHNVQSYSISESVFRQRRQTFELNFTQQATNWATITVVTRNTSLSSSSKEEEGKIAREFILLRFIPSEINEESESAVIGYLNPLGFGSLQSTFPQHDVEVTKRKTRTHQRFWNASDSTNSSVPPPPSLVQQYESWHWELQLAPFPSLQIDAIPEHLEIALQPDFFVHCTPVRPLTILRFVVTANDQDVFTSIAKLVTHIVFIAAISFALIMDTSMSAVMDAQCLVIVGFLPCSPILERSFLQYRHIIAPTSALFSLTKNKDDAAKWTEMLLGNIVLLSFVIFLHVVVVIVRRKLTLKKEENEENSTDVGKQRQKGHRRFSIPFWVDCAKVWFPAFSLRVAVLLFTGTTYLSVIILRKNAAAPFLVGDEGKRIAMLIASILSLFFFLLVLPIVVFLIQQKFFSAQFFNYVVAGKQFVDLSPRERRRKLQFQGAQKKELSTAVSYLLPVGRLEPNEQLMKVFGGLFCSFRRAEDYWVTSWFWSPVAFVIVTATFVPSGKLGCQHQFAWLAAVEVFIAIGWLIFRPFRSLFMILLAFISNISLACVLSGSALGTAKPNSPGRALFYCGLAAFVLATICRIFYSGFLVIFEMKFTKNIVAIPGWIHAGTSRKNSFHLVNCEVSDALFQPMDREEEQRLKKELKELVLEHVTSDLREKRNEKRLLAVGKEKPSAAEELDVEEELEWLHRRQFVQKLLIHPDKDADVEEDGGTTLIHNKKGESKQKVQAFLSGQEGGGGGGNTAAILLDKDKQERGIHRSIHQQGTTALPLWATVEVEQPGCEKHQGAYHGYSLSLNDDDMNEIPGGFASLFLPSSGQKNLDHDFDDPFSDRSEIIVNHATTTVNPIRKQNEKESEEAEEIKSRMASSNSTSLFRHSPKGNSREKQHGSSSSGFSTQKFYQKRGECTFDLDEHIFGSKAELPTEEEDPFFNVFTRRR